MIYFSAFPKTSFIFQNHAPEGFISSEQAQESIQEVRTEIENNGEKDNAERKARSLTIEELNKTESLIKSYGQSTKITETENGKLTIESLNIEFYNLKNALKTANLLNKLKSTNESYQIENNQLESIGYVYNTTYFTTETLQKYFPELLQNPDAFNAYPPLQPTGIKGMQQYDKDKISSDFYKKTYQDLTSK